MQAYETSATVQVEGEVHVVGATFAPGTEVEIAISPKSHAGKTPPHAAYDRLGQLLSAPDKAHNVEPIGPLNRDELYDRNGLH